MAEHTEWRRIGYVMEEEGLEVYDPELDPTAVRWAREEAEQERQERARQGSATKMVLTVPVDKDTYRHLYTCATAHGTTPRHLINLLIERVSTTPEGLVEVAPFTVESGTDIET